MFLRLPTVQHIYIYMYFRLDILVMLVKIFWPESGSKTWTKGHWTLDDLWPQVFWAHMCDSTQGSLYPSPMKIHQSMWIQWPFFFKNLNQRSLTPRWPLTHICWGHMCDSTQGSLCPSPMGIHQCMWTQWSILQNTTYYTLHILRIEWSHSLFLN